MTDQNITIFWFRRDLRLNDNAGLYHALKSGYPVLPLFIFDTDILDKLEDRKDRRVEFIHRALSEIREALQQVGADLLIRHGRPTEVWKNLLKENSIAEVYTNYDYEPYAIKRDKEVQKLLRSKNVAFHTFKDQVIFEKSEILTHQETPYTIYTPYQKRWKENLSGEQLKSFPSEKRKDSLVKLSPQPMPGLEEIGFESVDGEFPSKTVREEIIENYHRQRDYPGIDGTSRLGVHLRFGTVSVRRLVRRGLELNETWLDELIWREFYMMILWHFPHVVDQPFKSKYAKIPWRNNEQEFERWCQGKTGYAMVDAGMRELNQTGYMHNRVRMVTASFLTKHLLIDWRWGERYFARKLLDYELASNNGNWQWAAGCGCDAAPYFRIFNPTTQIKKFDPEHQYIKKWIPELKRNDYPAPIVEHRFARERALEVYGKAVKDK